MSDKLMTAAEMAAAIPDGAVIAVAASGGGLVEPDEIFAAIEARFLETGSPRNLTLIHALGFGDRDRRGANRFSHPGMVSRVIGGHWTWSKGMQDLARNNQIEAYSLPGGVISLLLRESGAGRPGLITRTGLGTFVDPEISGGRINEAAKSELVRRIEINGETYLHYLPLKVDVAILKGSYADLRGNLSFTDEPADLDGFAAALAAHNNGGKVFVQVRACLQPGALNARDMRVPGTMVDGVHVVPDQIQTYRGAYDLSLAGKLKTASDASPDAPPTGLKRVLALRAADELVEGATVNFGFGASAGIAAIIAERGQQGAYWTTIEQGIHGGTMMIGDLFGMAVNPMVILGATCQFDFYHGGGLDIAFLGMAEMDAAGNVNVSHIAGQFVGPGGFIDITQNARKVVFCGTFDAKGSAVSVTGSGLEIARHGQIRKLRQSVDAITFSGAEAQKRGQSVLYITERAVFELRPAGVTLVEIAPGVDLQTDILDQMDFTPLIDGPALMKAEHFA